MTTQALYNKNYLSKRPFMLITTVYKVPQHARTEKAGWANVHGWDVKESVQFVDRITDKHRQNVTVIIDVLEAKVIKNGFRDANPEDVMAHFLKRYKAEASQSIEIWMERQSQTKALADFIVEQEARLKAVNGGLQLTDITDDIEDAIEVNLDNEVVPETKAE